MAHDSEQNKGSLTFGKNSRNFLDELRLFHKSRGTPFSRVPQLAGRDVDLGSLYRQVIGLGGWVKVTNDNKWEDLLKAFRIPQGCTNGGTALKHIYIRFLDLYEKIHFLGIDPARSENIAEDETPTRKKPTSSIIHGVPLSYNYEQHNLSDYIRTTTGMCVKTHERSDYHKLIMALTSGLPNEVDFAMNVCLLLSNEGKHSLRLKRSHALLTLLLAHVGIFKHGVLSLRDLHCEGWMRGTSRDFGRFWFTSTTEDSVKRLVRSDKTVVSTESRCGASVLNLSCDVGAATTEALRVLQLAIILRNLSFDNENSRMMANNSLVFRFLLLCTYNQNNSLVQLALDTLGNLSTHIDLCALSDEHTDLLLRTVWSCLSSNDKFHVVRGLEIVGKLCQTETNEDVLMDAMKHEAYENIVLLLTVLDIQLIVFTLEALYQLSELGETSTTHIASIRHVVEMLVNLVTVEAQSYGTQSLVGIKVVEYITPPQATTTPAEFTPLPRTDSPVPPSSPAPVSTPALPSTPVKPAATTTASQTPTQPLNNNETLISKWLSQVFETNATSEISQLLMYSLYLSFCNQNSVKVVVGAAVFNKCIQSTFPSVELKQITRVDGKKEVLILGLQQRAAQSSPAGAAPPKQPSVLCFGSEYSTPPAAPSPNSNTLRQRLSQPPLSPNIFTQSGLLETPKSSSSQPARCVTPPPPVDSTVRAPVARNAVSRLERRFDGCSQGKDKDGSTNLIKSLLAKKLHRNSGTRPIQPKPPPTSQSDTAASKTYSVKAETVTAFPVVYATANVANVTNTAGIINFGVVCGPQFCAPQTQLCAPQTPLYSQQNQTCSASPQQSSQSSSAASSRQFRNIAPHPSQPTVAQNPSQQSIAPHPSTTPFQNQRVLAPNQIMDNANVENPIKKSHKRKRSKSPSLKQTSNSKSAPPAVSVPATSCADVRTNAETIASRATSEIPIKKIENKNLQQHIILQKQLKKHKLTRAQITRNRLKIHRDGKLSGIQDRLPNANDVRQGLYQVESSLIADATDAAAVSANGSPDENKRSIVVNLDMNLIERMPSQSANDIGEIVESVLSNLVTDSIRLCSRQSQSGDVRPYDSDKCAIVNNTCVSDSNLLTIKKSHQEPLDNKILKCHNDLLTASSDPVPSPAVVNGRIDECEDFPPSPTPRADRDRGSGLVNGVCGYDEDLEGHIESKRRKIIDTLKKSKKINGIVNHENNEKLTQSPGDLQDSYIVSTLNADLMNRSLLRNDNLSYINGISESLMENGALETKPCIVTEGWSVNGDSSVVSDISADDQTLASSPKIEQSDDAILPAVTQNSYTQNSYTQNSYTPADESVKSVPCSSITEPAGSKSVKLSSSLFVSENHVPTVAETPKLASSSTFSVNASTNTSYSSPISISIQATDVGTSPPFSPDKSSRDSVTSPDLRSPTLSEPDSAAVAMKSQPAKRVRVRPKPKPRALGSDGKPVKPSRSRKRTSQESAHPEQTAPVAPTPPAPQLMCEWDKCERLFATAKAVTCHVYSQHLCSYAGTTCLWPSCDVLDRSKWSLITHVQDHHCTLHQLNARAEIRLKEADAPTPDTETAPTPAPTPLVYPEDAALQAIRRFAARPPYQQLVEPYEGPVTKHIRLTSALILRNLARYSATGRTLIKRYEQRLSYAALSNVESSAALSNCLWAALHNH